MAPALTGALTAVWHHAVEGHGSASLALVLPRVPPVGERPLQPIPSDATQGLAGVQIAEPPVHPRPLVGVSIPAAPTHRSPRAHNLPCRSSLSARAGYVVGRSRGEAVNDRVRHVSLGAAGFPHRARPAPSHLRSGRTPRPVRPVFHVEQSRTGSRSVE
jgi:hypothetical protein